MTLLNYLKWHRLTYAAFAERIGVGSGAVVHRYANGARIPRPKVMRRIATATDGDVTADDFYDAAA